jgi:hypothetical protein
MRNISVKEFITMPKQRCIYPRPADGTRIQIILSQDEYRLFQKAKMVEEEKRGQRMCIQDAGYMCFVNWIKAVLSPAAINQQAQPA